MTFPSTHLTLIQRLASGGTEADWQRFWQNYWGPLCRFSLRFGAKNLDEAEDVASKTFEALWEQRLLVRWAANRSAKLRTLLCSVVRNILSHRNRVQAGRDRHREDLVDHVEQLNPPPADYADAFYAAWVEDVVQQTVETLAAEYCQKGQADYVRVLYGRLCQGMSIAETAQALELSATAVDHYFRHARDRLGKILEIQVRDQVECCCPEEDRGPEFAVEWQRLGQYLVDHGGLEDAVRAAYEVWSPAQTNRCKASGLKKLQESRIFIRENRPTAS
ncbi:MAG: hypothetical protein ABFC77_06005 [Thermoguttaceae bacterium]